MRCLPRMYPLLLNKCQPTSTDSLHTASTILLFTYVKAIFTYRTVPPRICTISARLLVSRFHHPRASSTVPTNLRPLHLALWGLFHSSHVTFSLATSAVSPAQFIGLFSFCSFSVSLALLLPPSSLTQVSSVRRVPLLVSIRLPYCYGCPSRAVPFFSHIFFIIYLCLCAASFVLVLLRPFPSLTLRVRHDACTARHHGYVHSRHAAHRHRHRVLPISRLPPLHECQLAFFALFLPTSVLPVANVVLSFTVLTSTRLYFTLFTLITVVTCTLLLTGMLLNLCTFLSSFHPARSLHRSHPHCTKVHSAAD